MQVLGAESRGVAREDRTLEAVYSLIWWPAVPEESRMRKEEAELSI